ncbi:MAG: TOBE domain-containing protein, partial [Steroidobacteraceae bacterium]
CARASLPLPAGQLAAPALAGASGEVVVGLRPEDLSIGTPSTAANTDDEDYAFDARLESVEPVGNEIFLRVRFNGGEYVCRVPPQPMPEPGQTLRLRYQPTRLKYFDANSGARLG